MGELKNPKPWSIFEYREVEDNRETATGKGMEKEKGSGGRGVLQVNFTYTIREGEANKKQHLLKTY